MEKIFCFEPIINEGSEILILGSMPSKKSREENFYYANPTNRFWKILSRIFNEDFVNASSVVKTELLHKHKIALYDVYKSCNIKVNSSLDNDIRNEEMNDIQSLIKDSKIKVIYITSKKAYKSFIKKYNEYFNSIRVEVKYLPSPSSANRSKYKDDEDLIKEWERIFNCSFFS